MSLITFSGGGVRRVLGGGYSGDMGSRFRVALVEDRKRKEEHCITVGMW